MRSDRPLRSDSGWEPRERRPARGDQGQRPSAFGGDLSQGFREGADRKPPAPRHPTDRRPAERKPYDDRRSGGPAHRSGPRSGERQEAPAYVKREPERGSRRREEDIGETWPELPEWATADALDLEVRRDLRGLSKEGADWVAAHLVAAGTLADEEPDLAWRHARAARARGGRIGVVRETVGLVAYRAGEWSEAIGELRAARRMGGGPGQLAVMADCERALGHPERAIELSRSAEADALDPESATELSIVVAGARADLGQVETAIAQMERVGPEHLESNPRLAYAYADLLLKDGRRQDALSWFIRSADADLGEETDALERVEELGAEESAGDPTARATGDDFETDLGVDAVPVSDPAVDDQAAPEIAAADAAGQHTTSQPTDAGDPTGSAAAGVADSDGGEPAMPTVVFSDDPQTGDR